MAAGLLGSSLGLGGGIIVIPALTLLFHIDIRYAVGASIVPVIATCTGVAAAYVREHMTNLRLAMLLEVANTTGALAGAFLSGVLGGDGSSSSSAWCSPARRWQCFPTGE